MIDGYSRRSIILFIITTIAATAMRLWDIPLIADLALHDLHEVRRVSPEQERALEELLVILIVPQLAFWPVDGWMVVLQLLPVKQLRSSDRLQQTVYALTRRRFSDAWCAS